jgi:hypothetical protein
MFSQVIYPPETNTKMKTITQKNSKIIISPAAIARAIVILDINRVTCPRKLASTKMITAITEAIPNIK